MCIYNICNKNCPKKIQHNLKCLIIFLDAGASTQAVVKGKSLFSIILKIFV